MARTHSELSRELLCYLYDNGAVATAKLRQGFSAKTARWADMLFRLERQGLIRRENAQVRLTDEARGLVELWRPVKDHVWKLVLFDIPEKHRYVRNHLREKLKTLGFQQWQGSIWISPYRLPEGVEAELEQIGRKFFVRLVFVDKINISEDLEKMFR